MTSAMRAERAGQSGVAPLRQRPLDLVHLARQTLGDPGIEAEVLRIFVARITAYHERLAASGTSEELLANLHIISGACMGVGAWSVADLARVSEAELKGGMPMDGERIDDIGMAIEEVCTFISGLVEDERAFS